MTRSLLEQCRRAREAFLGGAHKTGLSFCPRSSHEWMRLFSESAGGAVPGAELLAWVSKFSPNVRDIEECEGVWLRMLDKRLAAGRDDCEQYRQTFETELRRQLSCAFVTWAEEAGEDFATGKRVGPSDVEISAVLGRACVAAKTLESEAA